MQKMGLMQTAALRPRHGQAGLTLIEVLISMSIMTIIILAGTQLLQTSVKLERDMLESMDAASTEVLLSNRLFADLKYAAPSLNFLIRFDDGDSGGRSACHYLESVVPVGDVSKTTEKMALCDFYLYDPNCRPTSDGHDICHRQVTLVANDKYSSGFTGKRDFIIITSDTGVLNAAGVRGGGEYFSPSQVFELAASGAYEDNDCSLALCDHFTGFSNSSGANGLGSILNATNAGRYTLLSTTFKGTAEDTGYPDRYLHYLIGSSNGSKDTTLVKREHLLDYRFAWNYITDGTNFTGLHVDKSGASNNNALEINFHDEDIMSDKDKGKYKHYYYDIDDEDENKPLINDFLKIAQAYNGEQVDYMARPVRIVRYHLSDAYLRAQENGNANPDEKLRDMDPCLSRYVYHDGHWAGIECQYPGVKQITFWRSVSSLSIDFSIYMESDSERNAARARKKNAIADEG